jgi:hypothetical protein
MECRCQGSTDGSSTPVSPHTHHLPKPAAPAADHTHPSKLLRGPVPEQRVLGNDDGGSALGTHIHLPRPSTAHGPPVPSLMTSCSALQRLQPAHLPFGMNAGVDLPPGSAGVVSANGSPSLLAERHAVRADHETGNSTSQATTTVSPSQRDPGPSLSLHTPSHPLEAVHKKHNVPSYPRSCSPFSMPDNLLQLDSRFGSVSESVRSREPLLGGYLPVRHAPCPWATVSGMYNTDWAASGRSEQAVLDSASNSTFAQMPPSNAIVPNLDMDGGMVPLSFDGTTNGPANCITGHPGSWMGGVGHVDDNAEPWGDATDPPWAFVRGLHKRHC